MVRTRTAVAGIEQKDKKEDFLWIYDEKDHNDDSVGHDEGSNVKQQIRRNKRGSRTIIVMSMREIMFPLKDVGDGELLRLPMNRAAMVAARTVTF